MQTKKDTTYPVSDIPSFESLFKCHVQVS